RTNPDVAEEALRQASCAAAHTPGRRPVATLVLVARNSRKGRARQYRCTSRPRRRRHATRGPTDYSDRTDLASRGRSTPRPHPRTRITQKTGSVEPARSVGSFFDGRPGDMTRMYTGANSRTLA